MQGLLASEAVSYAQASRFVLQASEAAVFDDPLQAFHFAQEQNWLPGRASPHAAARLDSVSLLLMRSFDLRGGIMFTLTGARRFAYRQMEHEGFIHGRASPRQSVSGETLLYMTGRILSGMEERLGITSELELEAQRLTAEREALAALAYPQPEKPPLVEALPVFAYILFLADSTAISGEARQRLYEYAALLRAIPEISIAVAGHTAFAGTQEGRLRISAQRAQAVADLLAYFGARPIGEIRVSGYGAAHPVADNATAEGMSANRRARIIILEN